MQSLTHDQYQRLFQLAKAWQRERSDAFKGSPNYNPRLTCDALCFQELLLEEAETAPGRYLAGALVTPVSLSLVLLPGDATAAMPNEEGPCDFMLPSGRYPFMAERLDATQWCWRCELLDDLSDIESLQEASRLAQRLMDKVLAPPA